MNKRLKILIFIAIILAIVNLSITICKSLKNLPPQKKAAKNNFAIPAATSIYKISNGKNSSTAPQIVVPEYKRVFLVLNDIKCKYLNNEDDVDLSEEIILDSFLTNGELLKEIKAVRIYPGSPENKYYLVEKKSDARTAVISSKYCEGYYPLDYRHLKGLNSLFHELDYNEIMLSMFFNQKNSIPRDPLFQSLSERIKALKNKLLDQNHYRIYIKPEYSGEDSLFQISGKNLETLLNYSFKKRYPVTIDSNYVGQSSLIDNPTKHLPAIIKNFQE